MLYNLFIKLSSPSQERHPVNASLMRYNIAFIKPKSAWKKQNPKKTVIQKLSNGSLAHLDLFGLSLGSFDTFGGLTIQDNLGLLEVSAGVFVDENEGEVVAS